MVIILWLKFIVASLGLLFFGYKASKLGYTLSKLTLFSETFIGMIFLAISTSMPEMFVSVGSAGIAHSGNLAAGNVFGTLVINLMILVLIDIQRGGALLSYVDNQHIFTGLLCIMLLGVLIASIIIQNLLHPAYKIFNIGLDSILIFFVCIVSLRLLFSFENKRVKKIKNNVSVLKNNNVNSLKKLWIKFFIYILLVGIVGLWISDIADKIVQVTPKWDHTYFGSIFLAISSSLPEIVVSISSVRVGSVNMGVGNILGSNLFDTIIIPISDIFYVKDMILANISLVHIFTATIVIILTTIVITGIIYKSRKSFIRLSWPTIFMLLIFVGYCFLLGKLTH